MMSWTKTRHHFVPDRNNCALLLYPKQKVNKVNMNEYEQTAKHALKEWQRKMERRPGLLNNLSKKIQTKINSWIPEKVHNAITVTIKQMIRGVLFGAKHTTATPLLNVSLQEREELVLKRIDFYKNTAAVEG